MTRVQRLKVLSVMLGDLTGPMPELLEHIALLHQVHLRDKPVNSVGR
jgi:hypothetical protein